VAFDHPLSSEMGFNLVTNDGDTRGFPQPVGSLGTKPEALQLQPEAGLTRTLISHTFIVTFLSADTTSVAPGLSTNGTLRLGNAVHLLCTTWMVRFLRCHSGSDVEKSDVGLMDKLHRSFKQIGTGVKQGIC